MGDNMWNIPMEYIEMDREINLLKNQISQLGEPWCFESGVQAEMGECPTHHGDSCLRTPEGLIEMIQQYQKICKYAGYSLSEVHDIPDEYDPTFGDEHVCTCGHTYYRHFDTYEDMRPVGCKYCSCYEFKDNGDPDPGPPESHEVS
jgi:hypothetical protein